MRIAFTHNLKLSGEPADAEFDTPETVDAVTEALKGSGHIVEKVEVSGPASHLVARLEAFAPDIVFNTAEGRRGRTREAFYPALFEEMGLPYTGSDAYTCALTLDKHLTKLVVAQHGVDVPAGRLVRPGDDLQPGVFFPCLAKPNHEGSSKGISDESVAGDPRDLRKLLERAVKEYPEGVLVEQFIPGRDVSVDFLESHGVLEPAEYVVDPSYKRKFNLLDFRLKNDLQNLVTVRCPTQLPQDVLARLAAVAKTAFKALNIRDTGRLDFRLGDDGRIYFLDCNALPGLNRTASLFAAARRKNMEYHNVINSILNSAAKRAGLVKEELRPDGKEAKRKTQLRVGFAYNVKRVKPSMDGTAGDHEAEFDSPLTLDAIADAIASHGHEVVRLEATADLPRMLLNAPVDVVFNIAEGTGGRSREAMVPAMLELLGVPYTGSDAATLAVALDKALAKRVLRQHGVPTPAFQVLTTGKERLDKTLRYPLIVKPNAEGTSKGIGPANVVDNEEQLRAIAKELIERYDQRALVEEYILGREFTIGMLGDPHPRILPPMEIVFTDPANKRPLYDFAIKQDWNKHVQYVCPAQLTPALQKALEKVAKDTFEALDCRDVARVDVRLGQDGVPYVLEVNPLPGLTPDFSDLVLIAKAAGMDYRTLIAEILAGAIKRWRLQKAGFKTGKSRLKALPAAEGSAPPATAPATPAVTPPPGTPPATP